MTVTTPAVDVTETANCVVVRTAGIVDPESGRPTKSVVVFENDTVVELRDDAPEDVPIVLDTDCYAPLRFVDAHSHATIRPWEGN